MLRQAQHDGLFMSFLKIFVIRNKIIRNSRTFVLALIRNLEIKHRLIFKATAQASPSQAQRVSAHYSVPKTLSSHSIRFSHQSTRNSTSLLYVLRSL